MGKVLGSGLPWTPFAGVHVKTFLEMDRRLIVAQVGDETVGDRHGTDFVRAQGGSAPHGRVG